jgi:hypothetical protein
MPARAGIVSTNINENERSVTALMGLDTPTLLKVLRSDSVTETMDPANRQAMVSERETIIEEIRRGCECLEQISEELRKLESKLEEWPFFEKVCGHNPLLDYAANLTALGSAREFLPGWIDRRRARLAALEQRLVEMRHRHTK